MIRLSKVPKPAELLENEEAWTDEYARLLNGDEGVPAAAATRYRHSSIKERLIEETHSKCAYCESRFAHVYPGAIEHIEPKARVPKRVVDWTNLTLVCMECNTSKGDYWDQAQPLTHPYNDDPEGDLEAFGPLLQARPTSFRGALTLRTLDLNRAALLLERAGRLNDLDRLRRLATSAPDSATRAFYVEELERAAEPGAEFAMVARAYVQLVKAELSEATA